MYDPYYLGTTSAHTLFKQINFVLFNLLVSLVSFKKQKKTLTSIEFKSFTKSDDIVWVRLEA